MPGLVRKVVIVAALDGLVLQPTHLRNQRAVRFDYKTQQLTSTAPSSFQDEILIESHGIVGLLSVPPFAYLVAITSRQQVSSVRGSPIYSIKDVALIPLVSQADASNAITQANAALKKKPGSAAVDSDTDISDEEDQKTDGMVKDNASVESIDTESPDQTQGDHRRSSNVAQDVIGRKGQYGRFAEKWFSRKGWVAERRMTQGMSSDEPPKASEPFGEREGSQSVQRDIAASADHGNEQSIIQEQPRREPPNKFTLLPKLLHTTRLLLSSKNFFFSYDFDISKRFGLNDKLCSSDIPLYASFDPRFFWNRRLMTPFIEGSHHSFILPIMQGFVGQKSFILRKGSDQGSKLVPEAGPTGISSLNKAEQLEVEQGDNNFLLTLISRRSIERPGLRYLRRGIDDQGHTANTVETEQILARASWAPSFKIHSFVQIRGSIPLFFSQSPYSFKPLPTLQHSEEVNLSAFKRHFKQLIDSYGNTQIVSLTDKSGPEGAIGERYEAITQHVNKYGGINERQLGFEWFDFHSKCSGMRFDNIKLLIDDIHEILDRFGTSIELNGVSVSKQQGIVRTNCMDCLDRTNVVQTGFAQRALEGALRLEGFNIDFHVDASTQWFNSLWADNGDSISKQYSSTAALKGDFTRTRKRNYRGALNDLTLTLSRYYNNIVNDYFSQTTIDFLLGNVNVQVFEDYEENLMSRDPGMSMQKIRENAISTSAKIVIADCSEDLIAGWTLLGPRQPNAIRMLPLEESVLLLTDAALYKVYFDWSVEKVSSFERVDLRSIISLRKGVYITSTLTSAQTDEDKNVGFLVEYKPGKADVARVNTRSLSTIPGFNADKADSNTDQNENVGDEKKAQVLASADKVSSSNVLAFKALPAQSSVVTDRGDAQPISEQQLVDNICDEIKRVVLNGDTKQSFVKEVDIVSFQEAKKTTGYAEQWVHSLKRMVWG